MCFLFANAYAGIAGISVILNVSVNSLNIGHLYLLHFVTPCYKLCQNNTVFLWCQYHPISNILRTWNVFRFACKLIIAWQGHCPTQSDYFQFICSSEPRSKRAQAEMVFNFNVYLAYAIVEIYSLTLKTSLILHIVDMIATKRISKV